jgi:hypothetical protein
MCYTVVISVLPSSSWCSPARWSCYILTLVSHLCCMLLHLWYTCVRMLPRWCCSLATFFQLTQPGSMKSSTYNFVINQILFGRLLLQCHHKLRQPRPAMAIAADSGDVRVTTEPWPRLGRHGSPWRGCWGTHLYHHCNTTATPLWHHCNTMGAPLWHHGNTTITPL